MRFLVFFLFVFLFSACGGGGGGSSAKLETTNLQKVRVTGQFVASYVKGVKVCSTSDNCAYTDETGKFQLEVPNLPVKISFFVDKVKIGDYELTKNGEVINPFKVAGKNSVGDLLARFIHGLAGDTDGSAQQLDFSQVRIVDTNIPEGKSLVDLLSEGQEVSIEVQKGKENFYSVNYNPDKGTVEVCSNGSCQSVNYRQWLVLIYMAADNSLNDEARSDLNEIQKVKFNPQVKLVVLTDYKYDQDTVAETSDSSGELVFHTLDSEINSGDYRTLEDFVRTYYNRYPAKNVALILWDHGDGWRSGRMAASDNSNSSLLLMFQLRKALLDLKNDGITFSIIGFDECLMGMEEVLYDIKDFSDYFVVSENYEPGPGWNYTEVFSYLVENPAVSPEKFGREIVDAFKDTYSSVRNDYTLTLALFSRTDVERIADSLNQLYADLNSTTYPDFSSARNSSVQVVCDSNDENCSYCYVDLYSFVSPLSEKYPAAKEITDIIGSLYKVVIPGNDDRELHGISIYFPKDESQANSSGYSCYRISSPSTCIFNGKEVTGYYNPFASSTYWDDFLEKYLSLEGG